MKTIAIFYVVCGKPFVRENHTLFYLSLGKCQNHFKAGRNQNFMKLFARNVNEMELKLSIVEIHLTKKRNYTSRVLVGTEGHSTHLDIGLENFSGKFLN